jgi:hypothetical protein
VYHMLMASRPELLLPHNERAIRLILRAIIRAHPDHKGSTEAARLSVALSALLGGKPKRGRADENRDDLLEMMAFDYSVEHKWKKRADVSPTEIATRLVEYHPAVPSSSEKESVIRDLVRKFLQHKDQLLASHSFDGVEDFEAFYKPIGAALEMLQKAGVEVDSTVLPPGAQKFVSREK